jgi:hypothetical protein
MAPQPGNYKTSTIAYCFPWRGFLDRRAGRERWLPPGGRSELDTPPVAGLILPQERAELAHRAVRTKDNGLQNLRPLIVRVLGRKVGPPRLSVAIRSAATLNAPHPPKPVPSSRDANPQSLKFRSSLDRASGADNGRAGAVLLTAPDLSAARPESPPRLRPLT